MNQDVINYLVSRFDSLSIQEKMTVFANLTPEFIVIINKMIPNIPFIRELAIQINMDNYTPPTAESYLAWEADYQQKLLDMEKFNNGN
jgi:hypothetical protein